MRFEDYRATAILMLGLAAATLTGFLREAALAYSLGAGRATDIYLIAFTIPEFIFVALPIILTPAFLPLFAGLRLRAGEPGAWRFALRTAAALLALLVGISVLVAVAAPLLLQWLAPGFGQQERADAVRALRLMLPAIGFMGEAALAGAILQVYRRFGRPAWATAIYNLTFAAVLLGLPLLWVTAPALWGVPSGPTGLWRPSPTIAAWGVTLGAVAALAVQLPLLWRHRPKLLRVGAWGKGQKLPVGLGDLARLAGPLAAGYMVHHLVLFVDRALATTLQPGSVAALNYAYRLALVAGQLSGLAVATALFPRMAEQVAREDHAGLRSSLAGALRFVWLVGLPASLGLIILREPLVQTLFERGAFDSIATKAVSDLLVWYSLAVLADALCQPLWRVIYAWRSMGTVVAVNSLQTGIRIVGDIALVGPFGYNGLALSAALGLSIQVIVLGWLVRRRLGTFLEAGWWLGARNAVLAAIPALLAAGLLVHHLSAAPAVVNLIAGGLAGGTTYLLILRFLEKATS